MNFGYEKMKKIVLKELPKIPDLITEEWLNDALKTTYFRIWGFSFSDLSNKKFDKNINYETLRKVSYSTKTIFPKNSPIMMCKEMFKCENSIKSLHEQGITGKGINVAIIDYGFTNVPNEIKDNLVKYEKINGDDHFHGSVVSSILVGENIGVCPEANLYFFETSQVKGQVENVIKSLEKIYEMNEKGANIKIINISASIHREAEGFGEIQNKLLKQGCYVIDSVCFQKNFCCINKDCNTNQYYYSDWQSNILKKGMCVYMPTNVFPLVETNNDYQYCGQASNSWVIPVLSGLFALSMQLNPNITFDEFVEYAEDTKIIKDNGITLINPIGIIKKINIERSR